MHKMLIVGGVAAGATAAARARRLSGDAEITILEAGPDVSFANCGLPYFIGGDIESRSKLILQSPESFKDQYDVTVKTDTEVQAIDPAGKTVTALDRKSGKKIVLEYDSLILAQGGRPIVPPIPGVDKPQVFSLWTLQDMDSIDTFIREKSPRTAVVVGGGFIGLEMVEALTKRGLKVTVVERLPQVMPNLEAEIAGFITGEMISYGVDVLTSRSVTEVKKSSVMLDDGREIKADLVLMSVGVKPTLKLAMEASLAIGEAGGLLVDEYLQTSDPAIYAAGDMVEIEQRVSGSKVRIPLAGPANRQGRLAAGNALGHKRAYTGSLGTSVVRVFEAVAGSTGLSLTKAREAGIPADAVVVHKEHHTSYYPGAQQVTVMVIYNRETGVILGGQTAGYAGADRRLDVLATAAAAGMTVGDLSELDLAYSPPVGTANDAVNMAAFAAENRMSGFSPALTASELDAFAADKKPVVVDIRDTFSREKGTVAGSVHIPLSYLEDRLRELKKGKPLLILDENGKKGHQALRRLVQNGFTDVLNISGGYVSLERHARAVGFGHLDVQLLDLEAKTLDDPASGSGEKPAVAAAEVNNPLGGSNPIVLDVRTPGEFMSGAYPGAVNLPLDELGNHISELGPFNRQITVYCASGARSAYAQRILMQSGYTNVTNGGGIMEMMYSR
jgi:NADPH-dependent 2,4-dienoyl-CoA reductase/sulfur reductase-like enzyme/rhodanese-related sulfurtransferase